MSTFIPSLLDLQINKPNIAGDISGSYSSPTVTAINGNPLGSTTPTAGNILKANGTQWVTASPSALTSSNDTNVTITLGGSSSTALINSASITMGWTGTLAAGRLNSNVVQAITNDTNITGSISSQNLTLGWTGTLSASRLSFNSTNLQNTAGAINTIQNINTTASPTFGGFSIIGSGLIEPTITSTTGSVVLLMNRGVVASGANIVRLQDLGANVWDFGTVSGSSNFIIRDDVNSINILNIAPGSGTSSNATFAGTVTANSFSGSWSGSAALTSSNDTNVTITLGGSPSVSLLAATSITMGWTGTLSATRIAFNSTNLQNTSGSLNTIQNIAITSSPTFANITASSAGIVTSSVTSTTTGSTNNANFVANRGDQANGTSSTLYETAGIVGWETGMLPASGHYFVRDGVNNVRIIDVTPGSGTTSKVTFAGNINIAGLSNVNILVTDGANNVISGNLSGDVTSSGLVTTVSKINGNALGSTAPINGNALLGNGTQWVSTAIPTSIVGTANQVIASSATGTVTLSLPQSIAISSSVNFSSLTLGTTQTVAGSSKLYLIGTDSSAASGPHMTAYTATDQYPLFQLLPFAHNNVNLNFDSYYDGSWRSSTTQSSHQILKNNNTLSFQYAAGGGTAGGTIAWTSSAYTDASASGRWTFATAPVVTSLAVSSLVATNGSSQLTTSVSSLSPTFTGLTLGTAALTGTNSALSFAGILAEGQYINFGTGGRNAGVFHNGALFLTNNLNYSVTSSSYVYASTNPAVGVQLGTAPGSTGTGSLIYAPSGTSGNTVTASTALSWNSSGTINIPGLTISSLVSTDGSSNLTSSTTGLSPQFTALGLGTAATGYALTLQSSGNGLIEFANSSSVNKWQLLMQGASTNNLGFTEAGVSANRLVIAAGGNIGIGVAVPAYALDCAAGNIAISTAGNGLFIKEGSNAKQGTATLVSGSVVVSNTSVTVNSRIQLTPQNSSGTASFVYVSARTAGTSFTITSGSSLDTRLIAYDIFEPA